MTIFNERQSKFQDDIRHEWTDDVTIRAWRRWSASFFVQTRAGTEAVIRGAQVSPGMQVLDIASGSGEPAMSLAELVGPKGHVTATDLGPGMLVTAEENAKQRKISNITFRPADVHELPFADASFDRVTCRFGVMFFANIPRALGEIRRVLKPGGRVSFLVWGPRAQPLFENTVGVMVSHLPAPPPPPAPDAPQIFRFAMPGSLTAALQDAGYHDIKEEALDLPWNWPGPAEQLWEQFSEIAAPFRPIIASFNPEKRQQVFAAVHDALRRFEKNGKTEMNAKVNLASAAV